MTSTGGDTARTWRCRHCDGDMPLVHLTQSLRCPFCDEPQELDAGLRAELERYEQSVAAMRRQADRELDEVERMRIYRDKEGDRGTHPPLKSTRRHALWCPSCGAKNTIDVGQAVVPCTHCEAPLLPSTEAIDDGVAKERDSWREAQRARIQEERASELWRQRADFFAGGNFWVLVVAILSVITLVLLLFSGNASNLLLLVLGAACVLFVPWALWLKWRIATFTGPHSRAVAAFALRQGGKVLRRGAELREWLDLHWPSYYHPFYLAESAHSDYAVVSHDGLPMLLNLHARATDILDTARFHLLVALQLEGVRDEDAGAVDWTDECRRLVGLLERRGFTVEVWEAGILVIGQQRHLEHPRDGLNELESALPEVVELARAWG